MVHATCERHACRVAPAARRAPACCSLNSRAPARGRHAHRKRTGHAHGISARTRCSTECAHGLPSRIGSRNATLSR
eukprot:4257953-Prymnesium_polylepis.1